MNRRATASLVAFAFALWASTPALARVECRRGMVMASCGHCLKVSKAPPQGPAAKADCCIVQPAPERPLATTPGQALPHLDLAEAPEPLQPVLLALASVWTEGRSKGPAPPAPRRNQPLLR